MGGEVEQQPYRDTSINSGSVYTARTLVHTHRTLAGAGGMILQTSGRAKWVISMILAVTVGPSIPLVAQQNLPIPINGLSITINQNLARPKPNFVLRRNTACLPLRDLTMMLGAQVTYLRKDDAFQIRIPSHNDAIIVAPNSPEIWVGSAQSYFSQPTFFFEGQLFVPFEEFVRAIRFKLVKSSTGYEISDAPTRAISPQHRPDTTPRASTQATRSATVIVSSLPVVPKLDVTIPIQPTTNPLAIAFGAKVYPINGRYFYSNGELYGDVEFILAREGITVTKRREGVGLHWGNTSILWKYFSTDILVTSGNRSTPIGVGSPIISRQDVVYFPIKALASALGYGIAWDGASKRVVFVNRIERIAVVRSGRAMKVVIDASRPVIAQNPIPQDHDGGFSVDILDAQLACPSGVIDSDNPSINRLELRQVSDTRVRFKVRVPASVGYSPVQVAENGGIIILGNRVQGVSDETKDGRWTLTIKGTGTLNPRVWRMPPPSKAVVIDIHNSYSGLPIAIRTSAINAPAQVIRTSQFSIDPAVTRIVFDSLSSGNPTVKTISSSAFQVTMDPIPSIAITTSPSNSIAPTAPTGHVTHRGVTPTIEPSANSANLIPTRFRSASISRPSLSRRLHHKIIVIDPGHGGNDPGAIATDGTYEKAFTIDISNRLKRMLEESGAVVIMCRQHDENPSLQDRCDIGNNNNADIFLSIHINSFFHPYAGGTETFYYKPTDKPLAYCIQDAMVKALGFRDNGLKRGRLYVLRNTRMPAMLVEPGFITNPLEFSRMNQPEIREKIARAVADGTLRYVTEYSHK